MTANLTSSTAVISSDSVVQAKLNLGSGGSPVWCEIYGASATDVDNGERSVQEVETYRGTVIQTGEKTKPTITIEIASYLPHAPVMREINRLFENDRLMSIRWYDPEREITALSQGANNTISISTAGVVTPGSGVSTADLVAFAGDRVPEGVCIFTGTTPNIRDFIITGKTVASNGQLTSFNVVDSQTFAAPTAAITDEAFGFRIPRVAQPEVVCEIMSAGNQSGSVGQAGRTSTITLRAIQNLPPAVIESN